MTNPFQGAIGRIAYIPSTGTRLGVVTQVMPEGVRIESMIHDDLIFARWEGIELKDD